MKKKFLPVFILVVFSLLFTACPAEEDSDSGYTAEELSGIAGSALGGGYVSAMFYGLVASMGEANVEAMPTSGTLAVVVSGDTTTFTFTQAVVPMGGDGPTLTMNGAFSVTLSGSDQSYVFTAFSMSDPSSNIAASISGTMSITSTTLTGDMNISGITTSTVNVDVVMVWDSVNNQPSSVTSATIDGVDYLTDFQTAFQDFQ